MSGFGDRSNTMYFSAKGQSTPWDINDNCLPRVASEDDFQMWTEGHCRYVYERSSEDARRHISGWAMRNTNNHNIQILKKSCLGVLVCTKRCIQPNGRKISLRPAICDKARRKQLGRPCENDGCSGWLELQCCRGHGGYPVTHFWREENGAIYFQAKGVHDHARPEAKLPHTRLSRDVPSGKHRASSPNGFETHCKRQRVEMYDCACPPFECSHPNLPQGYQIPDGLPRNARSPPNYGEQSVYMETIGEYAHKYHPQLQASHSPIKCEPSYVGLDYHVPANYQPVIAKVPARHRPSVNGSIPRNPPPPLYSEHPYHNRATLGQQQRINLKEIVDIATERVRKADYASPRHDDVGLTDTPISQVHQETADHVTGLQWSAQLMTSPITHYGAAPFDFTPIIDSVDFTNPEDLFSLDKPCIQQSVPPPTGHTNRQSPANLDDFQGVPETDAQFSDYDDMFSDSSILSSNDNIDDGHRTTTNVTMGTSNELATTASTTDGSLTCLPLLTELQPLATPNIARGETRENEFELEMHFTDRNFLTSTNSDKVYDAGVCGLEKQEWRVPSYIEAGLSSVPTQSINITLNYK